MIVKTEAIVLSAMKYRDTSKIVRLYTSEFGKVSVIAKGARDSKSKFRSALEPMSYVAAVIYKNDNRELQLLSQCDAIRSFRYLSEDMEKMYAAMSALELVDIVTQDEEQNMNLFMLLLNVLELVNAATKSPLIALYYFETKLSDLLGFQPNLYICSRCGKNVEKMITRNAMFTLATQGVFCSECSHHPSSLSTISSATLQILQKLQETQNPDTLMDLNLSPSVNEEVRHSLRQHLHQHIEGFRGLRSEEVFAAIL